MAQTIIDISTPNDGLGDPLRVAMDLQNGMNTELYNTKVDKVLGKELSSNDYTSAEKSKLAGIEAGAQVNVPADWNTLLNKPAELNNSVGYFYYDNTITALSFLAGVEKKLTNNKLGTETDVTHPPYGVTSLWDSTTNALDFSQLNVGDSVDLRLDHETTTTINNQEVKIFVRVGIGSANPKDIVFNHSFAKTSGAQGSESSYVSFPIITEDVRDYPAELYVKSIDDGTILVVGFFIRAIRSGLNIIDVIVETDAPIDGVLYGRKDEAWEAVPVYVAGTNVTIDNTDPLNPIVSASGGGSQDLQSVTDLGATTTNAITVQGVTISGVADDNVVNVGSSAGALNTGIFTTNIGVGSGYTNSGTSVVNIGINAGSVNSGSYVLNIGDSAGSGNSGDEVTNIGVNAGSSNAINNVINLGQGAQATATNQIAINPGVANTAINLPATATELTLRASASIESIAYLSDITGGSGTLDGLTDVEIATPLNNQVLAYETSSGLWKNKTNPKLEVLQVTPVTLTAVSWSLVSGLYEYTYSNAAILATSIVDVIPANASISIVKAAEVLPSTSSSLGSVKLYATNLPTANIIVTFNIFN